MKKSAILSIAPHAGSELGHPFVYQKLCDEALTPLGFDFSAYLPLKNAHETLPEGWVRFFHPLFNRRSRRKYFIDCIRLLRKEKKEAKKRVFFIEFFGRRDLRLFAIAALLFGKKKDAVFLLYRDDLTIRRRKDRSVIFLFSKLLKLRFKDRFFAGSDSDLLATYYEKKLGVKLDVLPIPHTFFHPICFEKKEKLLCTWPGHPRPEKGGSEIERLTQIQDPLSSNFELDVSGATMLPKIRNGLKLTLRHAMLTEEDYRDSLIRADIVLLPYDAEKYKWRTSGIFVEAIMAGKMPLVKEGSFLARELKKYELSELIVDWKEPLFFTKLHSLANDASIKERLKHIQSEYQKLHCLESFKVKLKEMIGHLA